MYICGYIFQFSSFAQSCPTLCDTMNCSTSGLPDNHQLPKLAQTHVHPVSDVIQPSHPLSFPMYISHICVCIYIYTHTYIYICMYIKLVNCVILISHNFICSSVNCQLFKLYLPISPSFNQLSSCVF